MSNELGVPSPVGRVSMNIGGMNYATAGSHESNLQAGFFHPSCVITVNVLDGLANRIRPQQITVPYIIEAPVRFIDTPKGMQPNMVIEDADALLCCEPIWVQKNNLEGIVRAIAAGHKLIGEHKPFNRKQLFMVFMPAQPKWKSLNQAVEFSTPYPNGNKA
jgi:hypothetical protein